MIEVTDEMGRAYAEAFNRARRTPRREGHAEVDALAAVLAIVERDYRTEPRPPWERAPHCPVVNDRCPGDANGWICSEPCGSTP